MKLRLAIFLSLIPAMAMADRLGSLRSNADVLLTTQAVAGSMSPGATYYVQVRDTLQSGATFYVSSGTVNGPLTIRRDDKSLVLDNTNVIVSRNVLGYSLLGSNTASIAKLNYNGLCSDLTTNCASGPITLDFPDATSKYTFNNDGRFFVVGGGTGTLRNNAYSSVIGGSLIVGGKGTKNYTDTQNIGDGNLFVNNGVVASTLTVSGLTSGECVQTTTGGLLTTTGAACGSGSGSGDNLGSGVGSYGVLTTTGSFTGAGGVSVTYGVVAGSVTANDLTASQFVVTDSNKKMASSLNGSSLTSLTGANIATVIPSSVLPSTVAYLTSTNTWTAQQNYTRVVNISSSVHISDSPGTSGQVLTSGGPGSAPTWTTPSITGGGDNLGNHISTKTLTVNYGVIGSTFAFSGPTPSTVTYGLAVGSLSVTGTTAGEMRLSELPANGSEYVGLKASDTISTSLTFVLPESDGTSGQFLKTDGNKNLSWGTATGSGGGGGNTNAANQFSLPYYSFQGSSNALSAYPNVVLSTVNAVTISTGVTFTSSITINNISTFTLTNVAVAISSHISLSGDAGSAGKYLQSQGYGAAPVWTAVSATGGGDNLGSHTATMTITAPYGIQVSTVVATGGVTAGSATITGLTASQPVKTNASKVLVSGTIALSDMDNRATQTFIGRNTAGTGVPEELSVATAKTMLNLTGTNSGDQTITLSGDATGSGTSGITVTNSAAQPNITTFASSITVNGAGGLFLYKGMVASTGTFTGGITAGSATVTGLSASQFVQTDANKSLVSSNNGSALTTLTGSAIATVIPSSVLVSTVAFKSSTNTWTAVQNFTSSNTFTGAIFLSSSIVTSGQGAGTSGQVLQSQGPGATPIWATSSGGGYATVQDEGSGLTQRTTLNFTGTGVSCADNAGSSRTDCTINSGAASAGGNSGNVQFNQGGSIVGASGFNVWDSSITMSTGTYKVYSSTFQIDGGSLSVNSGQVAINNTSSMTLAGGAYLGIAPMAAPTTPNAGSVWPDTTYNAWMSSINAILTNIPTTLFTVKRSSNTNTTTGIVNMLDNNKLNGTISLPGNFWKDGKTIYMVLVGTQTRTGTPTFRAQVSLGSTVVLTTATAVSAGTYTAETLGRGWIAVIELVCTATGASGTFSGAGRVDMNGSISLNGQYRLIPTGNTVDTTTAQALQFQIQWGTANAANSLTLMGGHATVHY